GDYESSFVANSYVDGDGGGIGPGARFYDVIDYAVWFLSDRSAWLPSQHRAYLLKGMQEWAQWLWNKDGRSDSHFEDTEHTGSLWAQLWEARDSGKREVRLTRAART